VEFQRSSLCCENWIASLKPVVRLAEGKTRVLAMAGK
jgi:hypothetical protein